MKGQRKREKNLRLDLSIIILLTSRLWNAVSKKVYVHFYDNSFSSSTVVYFLTTTVTTVTTGRTGATLYVTRWHTTGTTRLLLPTCFSRQLSCFFNDNGDNNNNGKNGRTLYVTGWHTTGTTRLLLPTRFFRKLKETYRQLCVFCLDDNRDNSDNGKNGRNALCHEVTYNWDNKITVANLFFSSTVVFF